MSLTVTDVVFDDFRNHQKLRLTLGPAINIIVGDNAVGKTNVVEGLVYLTTGESFRSSTTEEAIAWGEERSRISLKAPGDGRELELVCYFDPKKHLEVNGKAKRLGEYKGVYPSVLFVPDDLSMVKGPASLRRQALDNVGIQLSQSYYKIKKDYEKVITQRNSLLKDKLVPKEYLDTWTESMKIIGLSFYRHRVSLFNSIKEAFEQTYVKLNEANRASLEYEPSWNKYLTVVPASSAEELYEEALETVAIEEAERGVSLIGPHRDEIRFHLDGRDARSFGSQGQQRLLTITWKLAELQVIEKISGKKPLLLLDDVMSEFDDSRRQALMHYIGEYYQTVITTTTLDYFSEDVLEKANIIRFGGEK